jgi:peptidoglycan/LPS O-acetylase OafA/YrhL
VLAVAESSPRADKQFLEHMPQLDSLRALAALSVFVTHFIPADERWRHLWGWMGVRLFFVLSGFLITSLLLTCRFERERQQLPMLGGLGSFYARRFLRLFPIYYAYLAAAVLGLGLIGKNLGWFLSYTQNFLFLRDGRYTALAHFWTLAVEEQFYLMLPWMMVYVPVRHLLRATVIMVLLGPATRVLGLLGGLSALQVEMLPFAHFDTLGLGALLAVVSLQRPERRGRLVRVACAAGWPLFAAALLLPHLGVNERAVTLFAETSAGLFFLWVVGTTALGVGGPVGWFLDRRWLLYLGKISYGLYVFHFNVPGLLREQVFPRLGLAWPSSLLVRFVLQTLVAIAIAMASWHLYESPINRLKRHFPYWPRAKGAAPRAAGSGAA